MTSLVYLDTSALVKLVNEESESSALRRYLVDHPRRATCVISRIELLRAARRQGGAVVKAEKLLRTIAMLRMDERVIEDAARIDPPTLRSLDAIHLAAAAALSGELRAVVAYDRRLLAAASAIGLPVAHPGAVSG